MSYYRQYATYAKYKNMSDMQYMQPYCIIVHVGSLVVLEPRNYELDI